jgi:tol-pal system protein YbgF
LRSLRGRVDVAEKTAADALVSARLARQAAAIGSPEGPLPEGDGAAAAPQSESEEVRSYRVAYAAWRGGQTGVCIDRFRQFLQSFPSSSYADDAAYWMADCHFKQGEYKNAVLRFDDVVRNYPDGGKAPDALYRQGEAFLKLGPGMNEAARLAFERVIDEYPDSALVEQAKRQIEVVEARR